MIDQFTRETFEAYLETHNHLGCEPYICLDIIDGEWTYKIPLDGQSAIMIRSSVRGKGQAAPSGKDSIRLWLVGNDNKPISSKMPKTQRIDGWQERLDEKIYAIAKRRELAGDCPNCQKPFGVYQNKKTKEWFAKCFPCSDRLRQNVNGNLNRIGWFSPASRGDENVNSETEPKDKNLAFNDKQGNDVLQPKNSQSGLYENKSKGSGKRKDMQSLPKSTEQTKLANFLENPYGDEVPETPKFAPSKYQTAIYDFVENENGHGVVSGVAGCGKTTTNVEALQLVPKSAKIKYAAFNKHIERDISAKAPGYVDVSTFHSWGLSNVKHSYPKIKINQWKLHGLIDAKSPRIERDLKNDIVRVIGLLKGNLLQPTQENVLQVADSFGIEILEKDCSFIRQIFMASIRDFREIDFDDMVYYPASGIVSCTKFEHMFVDEAQDMNTGQYELCKRSLAKDGRMLLIGDPNQSIYAFRGAHVGIMDFMAQETDATKLPLTISYRAPLAIVALVNEQYPHIEFEACKTAKEGLVAHINETEFLDKVDENSGVLCRLNAPLVGPCFDLIRRGIKATILGRDIGAGLIKLIEKREKMKKVVDLDDLLSQVNVYCNNEIRKAKTTKRYGRASLLEDQAETIFALSDDCRTIKELKDKAANVFSDKRGGVTFSTVHKAKGLEWEKVFVVGPKGNHPMGDWQQETNIRYVRDTRTLDQLYYVGE